MVNPIAAVNAKSLLTVELTIAPTSGEPNKFLISEGCRFTNLKYLEGGKEITVSGVCKVIQWNYIKLPDKKNDCIHDTTSMFSTQCIATAMVVDCSSQFSSDIREIPILAVRGCDKIEDANGGEVSPKPPVGDDDNPNGEGVVSRITITGTVDQETGVLSDAVVTVTLSEAVADEDVEEFVATSTLTIVTDPSDAPGTTPNADDTVFVNLSEVDLRWDDTATFGFDTDATFDLKKIKAGGAVATLTVGNMENTYVLTEEDVPAWAPDTPTVPEDKKITLVSVEATAGELTFVLSGATAETDPACVILNDSVVVKGFVGEDGEDGQRVYTAPISGQSLKVTNNTISIHGDGYHLISEKFDGVPATVATGDELSSAVADAIKDVKTQLAASTTLNDMDGVEEVLYARAVTGIPADLTVTGVVINGTQYQQDDQEWLGSDTTKVYGLFNVYTVENGNVSVNVAALLKAVDAEGTVDIRIRVVTASGRSANSDYVISGVRVCGNDRLVLNGVSVVDTVDGYSSTVEPTASGITLNREHSKTGVAIPLVTASGAAVEDTHVFIVHTNDSLTEITALEPVVDGKVVIGKGNDFPNNTESVSNNNFTVIASAGVVSFSMTTNDTVRPALTISDMAIDGTIDFEGVVTDYEISFAITPATMTKAAIANAVLNIYGTAINEAVGLISTNITVTNGVVIVKAPTGSTLDVTGIKNGTIATLVLDGETAIATNVSVPTYVAPVLRSIVLIGAPDFETGVIASGELTIKFDQNVDISKMKVYATALGFNGNNLGTMTGVIVDEDGTITVPVTNVNAADLQSLDVINVSLKRGEEEFTFSMARGVQFPEWSTPPVVTRVELCGTPDEKTGMIADPVIKVTFDKAADLSEAKVSIAELGVSNVALTGDNVLMVGSVANVTLGSGVSVAGAPAEGMTAEVVNKTMTQTYSMVADTDYPTWVAPAILTRVQVLGTVTDGETPEIANPTIELTYDKQLTFTSGSVTVGSLIVDQAFDNETATITENTSEEDGTITDVTVTITHNGNVAWADVPETDLVATVTIDGNSQNYTMVKGVDYPVHESAVTE